ncbi:MAG: hypothetical protein C4333_07400 [Meiothermus sp.]
MRHDMEKAMDKPLFAGEAGPEFPADWPGTYAGQVGGVGCVLELRLDREGNLGGRLYSGEERLEVSGVTGGGSAIRGWLYEPGERAAVAVFRASLEGPHLLLEMEVPEPDDPDFSGAERA